MGLSVASAGHEAFSMHANISRDDSATETANADCYREAASTVW